MKFFMNNILYKLNNWFVFQNFVNHSQYSYNFTMNLHGQPQLCLLAWELPYENLT